MGDVVKPEFASSLGEVVELEEISTCPECGSRLFEVVETRSSNGPYCRCSECGWEGRDDS
ncbi:hypothetical protein LCGC14_2632060 [marine sediment metagenome]|uniref:TFIIS-type domain-containing protein n=1 Tax=marine sediment metagenome TaxID=412755 RepID=A0A0F9AMI1_9ZZZZ